MEEQASRVELFVRIVYGIVLGIIAGIWGFFAFLASIIQWFFILITGEREPSFWGFVLGFFRFVVKVMGYLWMITDKRPQISGEETPYPVTFAVRYDMTASRLELFVRIVYGLFLGIIADIWGFFAELAGIVQWLYILIMGKRHGSLWRFTVGYIRFSYRMEGYLLLLTDERPPVSGEEL
jgi:uncharacterized protein with PQ loop repeat